MISVDMRLRTKVITREFPGPSAGDAEFRCAEISASAYAPSRRLDRRVRHGGPPPRPRDPGEQRILRRYPHGRIISSLYANLHDPPLPQEESVATRLRASIGEPLLDAYLGVRARNFAIDGELVRMTAQGAIDRLAINQSDAGPVGLHVKEVSALQQIVASSGAADRASIEPGADELGMALVAHALARDAGWTPRIAVRYSMPERDGRARPAGVLRPDAPLRSTGSSSSPRRRCATAPTRRDRLSVQGSAYSTCGGRRVNSADRNWC